MSAINVSEERFALALGRGLIEVSAEVPQDLQKQIFEQAVYQGHRTAQDKSLREQLAVFLHDRHPRTEDSMPAVEGRR